MQRISLLPSREECGGTACCDLDCIRLWKVPCLSYRKVTLRGGP